MGTPNSIDLQVMWNRLIAIVEEQAQVLVRGLVLDIDQGGG